MYNSLKPSLPTPTEFLLPCKLSSSSPSISSSSCLFPSLKLSCWLPSPHPDRSCLNQPNSFLSTSGGTMLKFEKIGGLTK
ncbi:hypothetical protein HanPSC8_Chr13g0560211 [Helianthus annuus]|nr:hypothetical protein HanPSC8_Chr13g0560211 [Helianthus annuus]